MSTEKTVRQITQELGEICARQLFHKAGFVLITYDPDQPDHENRTVVCSNMPRDLYQRMLAFIALGVPVTTENIDLERDHDA